VYEKEQVSIGTLAERVRHVVECTFNGRRITIFSGGAFDTDAALLEQIEAIHEGGGFGSIVGRNSFQRSKADAIALLGTIMDIYRN
jgi:fructose-bisphosphate aldolase, class I